MEPRITEEIPVRIHQLICDLYKKGNSVEEISGFVRIDFQQISAIVERIKQLETEKSYTIGIDLPAHVKEFICELSRDGSSLKEIAQLLGLETQAVMNVLAEVIQIRDAELMKIIELRERGKSLEGISEDTGIDVDFLKMILPETVIENPSLPLIEVIPTLQLEGKTIDEISRKLNLSRELVEGCLMCLSLLARNIDIDNGVGNRPGDAEEQNLAKEREAQLEQASAYRILGDICLFKNDYNKAEIFYMESLSIYEAVHPAKHRDLANIYSKLGEVNNIAERYSEAERYYLKCLDICEEILPKKDPDLADTYYKLGKFYINRREDIDKAEVYFLKSLRIKEKILPPKHPDLDDIWRNLWGIYVDKGNPFEVIRYSAKIGVGPLKK